MEVLTPLQQMKDATSGDRNGWRISRVLKQREVRLEGHGADGSQNAAVRQQDNSVASDWRDGTRYRPGEHHSALDIETAGQVTVAADAHDGFVAHLKGPIVREAIQRYRCVVPEDEPCTGVCCETSLTDTIDPVLQY